MKTLSYRNSYERIRTFVGIKPRMADRGAGQAGGRADVICEARAESATVEHDQVVDAIAVEVAHMIVPIVEVPFFFRRVGLPGDHRVVTGGPTGCRARRAEELTHVAAVKDAPGIE